MDDISYPILFYIKCEDNYQYAIKYNDEIFFSEWNDNICFNFGGLNIEIIYNNMVRTVTNIDNSIKNLDCEIQKQNQILNLEKEISKLESKIRSEKQFNIKVQYNEQVSKLKKEREKLINE